MLDHLTIRGSDRAASEHFYGSVLATLGIERDYDGEDYVGWGQFVLAAAEDAHPATRRLHVGFAASSRADVDSFWRIGTEAGYAGDGAPGLRPQYRDDYYGAFLLDPDGNSVEAVHHGALRDPGGIDHVWLRVADVEAARRFYGLIAPYGGYTQRDGSPVGFGGSGGSLTLVPGAPTRHLHIAFPASDNATVDAFHAAATRAGYRDNGPPAERVAYGPGYYAAFVLDPDGTNVEIVNYDQP